MLSSSFPFVILAQFLLLGRRSFHPSSEPGYWIVFGTCSSSAWSSSALSPPHQDATCREQWEQTLLSPLSNSGCVRSPMASLVDRSDSCSWVLSTVTLEASCVKWVVQGIDVSSWAPFPLYFVVIGSDGGSGYSEVKLRCSTWEAWQRLEFWFTLFLSFQ